MTCDDLVTVNVFRVAVENKLSLKFVKASFTDFTAAGVAAMLVDVDVRDDVSCVIPRCVKDALGKSFALCECPDGGKVPGLFWILFQL